MENQRKHPTNIDISQYTPKPNYLKGRVLLVTGASRGMGYTAAKAYASFGATVILVARHIKQLETLYDEIEQNGSPKPAIYPMNLANATPHDYEALMQNIEQHFGQLDGILLNAALVGSLTPIEHYDIEQWYQVLQVNLHSNFLLTQASIPLLKRSKDASILFTTAPVGLQGKAYWGAYSVSKFGVQGLMQTLADELENTNIRVNSINPIQMRTFLRNNLYPGENPNQLPEPSELLPTYLYLMGADSRHISGQTFTIPMPARKKSYPKISITTV